MFWMMASEPFRSRQAGSAGLLISVSQLGGSLLFVPCPVESDCSFLWSPVKVKGSEDKGSRESEHRVQFEPRDAGSPEGHF